MWSLKGEVPEQDIRQRVHVQVCIVVDDEEILRYFHALSVLSQNLMESIDGSLLSAHPAAMLLWFKEPFAQLFGYVRSS